MKISSTAVINGNFADKYGKRSTKLSPKGKPTLSIPFKIDEAPENAVSFALLLEDKDAIPVCGFSWIHWVVCDLTRTEVLENESETANDFIQGTTSFHGALGSESQIEAAVYGGMGPPDAPHLYELHVYALDTKLNLKKGFYYNELYKAMKGHILAETTLSAYYEN